MSVAQQGISAPFDAVADRYDETFTESKVGRAQRGAVWTELEKAFHRGDSVLEIGCGTGVDACFLAEHGVRVVACDSAPRMIEMALRRVAHHPERSLVDLRLLSAEELGDWNADRRFDGALSNFGALNCVRDLDALARSLGRLLKPGATAMFCLMGPCCLWEVGWYLVQAKPSKAFRRFHHGGVTAPLGDGASLHVRYPSVQELARTFAPEFRLKSIKGVGLCVPPSYLEPWARRFPRTFDLAISVDAFLTQWPGIRILADHILVTFERQNLSLDCNQGCR
jgi:ubiquinone/menaquinone biosynthesis C-methylase UbiE